MPPDGCTIDVARPQKENPMRKNVWLLLLAVLSLSSPRFTGNSAAAPPNSQIGATAVVDTGYNGIGGDVYGQSYTNGQLGVTCVFDLADGNLHFDTANRQANPK